MIFLISTPMSGWLRLSLSLILIFVYFIPTFIAYNRNKKNKETIFMINLFLGWTVIAWLGILIWVIVDKRMKVNN